MNADFSTIVCTEHTLNGSPRLDGRRLAVGDVVSSLHYNSLPEILTDYELTQQQVRQALQYCAVQQCVTDKPIVFCHNCSLRRQQEGQLDIANLEEIVTEAVTMVRGESLVFFGTMAELLADWQGQNWWIIAGNLLIDLRNELLEND